MVKVYTNYDGRQYRCVISDVYGNSVESDIITLHISNQITIGDFVFDLTEDKSGYSLISYNGKKSRRGRSPGCQ